jgi:hypothetical protein
MNLSQAITLLIILIAINTFYNYRVHQKSLDPKSFSSQQAEKRANRKPMQTGSKIFGTFIFIIPLFGGIFNLNYWFKDYNLARETVNWNKYEGVLISKDIAREERETDSKKDPFKTITYYSPAVVYHFSMDGEKYRGTNIDYNSHPIDADKDNVIDFLKTLPEPGENITVYADDKSDKTDKTVIIPGTQNMSYFAILIAIPFIAIGFIGMKFVWGL